MFTITNTITVDYHDNRLITTIAQLYFILRPIVKSKHGEKLRESGSLSYTRLRECFKGKLKSLGFLAECHGLHSLRGGGAIAAANEGIPDRSLRNMAAVNTYDSAKDGSLTKIISCDRLVISLNIAASGL